MGAYFWVRDRRVTDVTKQAEGRAQSDLYLGNWILNAKATYNRQLGKNTGCFIVSRNASVSDR